jgi:hypothetical protein
LELESLRKMSADEDRPAISRREPERRLPDAWTTPWVDAPPLRLTWFPIAGENAGALLERIGDPLLRRGSGPFDRYACIENIRAAELPYYPGFLLLDIQVATPGSEASDPAAIASLIYGPSGVTPLDGASPLIHALNSKWLDLPDEAMALSYLHFFCAFVRGEEGPFSVIDDVGDLNFKKRTSAKTRAAISKKVFAPRATPPAGAEDAWRFEALVLYGSTLYCSTFEVMRNGSADMSDDTPLMEDLPMLRRRYQGVFRFPPA